MPIEHYMKPLTVLWEQGLLLSNPFIILCCECTHLLLFMCMGVLPAPVPMHHMGSCCPWRPENGIRAPVTGGTDGCRLPSEYRELNLVPVEEQQVLLNTELYLHLVSFCCLSSHQLVHICLVHCPRAWMSEVCHFSQSIIFSGFLLYTEENNLFSLGHVSPSTQLLRHNSVHYIKVF